jgi:hypothetical protein
MAKRDMSAEYPRTVLSFRARDRRYRCSPMHGSDRREWRRSPKFQPSRKSIDLPALLRCLMRFL